MWRIQRRCNENLFLFLCILAGFCSSTRVAHFPPFKLKFLFKRFIQPANFASIKSLPKLWDISVLSASMDSQESLFQVLNVHVEEMKRLRLKF